MCIVHEISVAEGGNVTGDRWACAQAGCQECQAQLLEQHAGLIVVVVRRQCPGEAEYADLIQEGRIALWQAILHFDAQRGYAFSSYAGKAIQYRVWDAVRAWGSAAVGLEVERAGESLGPVVQAWQQEQVRQAIGLGLAQLPERLEQVLRRTYGLDGQAPQSFAALGRELGYSRERIRQLHNQALALLRLPLLSWPLRSVCEQDSRRAYQQSQALNRAWQRRQRRRRA
jgi:RNA polymerase sigma factor (sigma-70 family)